MYVLQFSYLHFRDHLGLPHVLSLTWFFLLSLHPPLEREDFCRWRSSGVWMRRTGRTSGLWMTQVVGCLCFLLSKDEEGERQDKERNKTTGLAYEKTWTRSSKKEDEGAWEMDWKTWTDNGELKLTVEVDDGSFGDKPCCVRGREEEREGEKRGREMEGRRDRVGRRKELYTQF